MFDIGSVLGAITAGMIESSSTYWSCYSHVSTCSCVCFDLRCVVNRIQANTLNTLILYGFRVNAGTDSILGGTACSDLNDSVHRVLTMSDFCCGISKRNDLWVLF